jgi:hypothetical protein
MDKINYWSQVAVLVFTFALAIAAALQWWSGGKLDEARRAERAQTESRIATAEKQAAEATRKAEEERLARAPRSLTPEQRASLLAALQRGPQGAVNIVIPIGDGEALDFARELYAVLQEARWPATEGGQITILLTGLWIAVGNPTSPPPHALAFQRALAAIGLAAQLRLEGGHPAQSLILIVGKKPQQ